MSGLIIPGVETKARPNRKARLAQKALAGRPVPNMQPRLREIAPALGAAVGMGPSGPMLIIHLADGQQIPMPFNADQARQTGIALITVAAHYELLKKMQSDEAGGEPVPTNPDLEQLLAEAQANTAGATDLKGDEEGEVEDDCDLAADPTETVQFNSFDVNGQPCYEPPTAD